MSLSIRWNQDKSPYLEIKPTESSSQKEGPYHRVQEFNAAVEKQKKESLKSEALMIAEESEALERALEKDLARSIRESEKSKGSISAGSAENTEKSIPMGHSGLLEAPQKDRLGIEFGQKRASMRKKWEEMLTHISTKNEEYTSKNSRHRESSFIANAFAKARDQMRQEIISNPLSFPTAGLANNTFFFSLLILQKSLICLEGKF